jgi:hypothetical protein
METLPIAQPTEETTSKNAYLSPCLKLPVKTLYSFIFLSVATAEGDI